MAPSRSAPPPRPDDAMATAEAPPWKSRKRQPAAAAEAELSATSGSGSDLLGPTAKDRKVERSARRLSLRKEGKSPVGLTGPVSKLSDEELQLPRFQAGQTVHHFWAPWFATAKSLEASTDTMQRIKNKPTVHRCSADF